MSTTLVEIAAKLAQLGCGTVGTTIFRGRLPDDPVACCAVYEYSAGPPEFGFGTAGIHYEYQGIQVAFRGAVGDHVTPRALAELAYRGLAAVEATTLSGTFYHGIKPVGPPSIQRWDESERPIVAVNFIVTKEPSTP